MSVSNGMNEALRDAFCSETLLAISDVATDVCQLIVDGGPATQETIVKIYADWKAGFIGETDDQAGPGISYFHNFPLNSRGTITSCSVDNAGVGPRGGIDFPIWFAASKKRERPRRVMIIGQDPQRRASDYAVGQDYSYPIGTPYALHDQRARNGRTSTYWKEAHSLLIDGCDVYLTDLYKVYQPGVSGSRRKAAQTHFKSALQIECNLYRPDLIVTFGRVAYASLCPLHARQSFVELGVFEALCKLRRTEFVKSAAGKSIPIVPLLHPSGMATRHREKFFAYNARFVSDPTFNKLITHALATLDASETT